MQPTLTWSAILSYVTSMRRVVRGTDAADFSFGPAVGRQSYRIRPRAELTAPPASLAMKRQRKELEEAAHFYAALTQGTTNPVRSRRPSQAAELDETAAEWPARRDPQTEPGIASHNV